MNSLIDDNLKTIHDPLHKYIHISNLAIKFIDNPIFQRLRDLHQLGTCHYVFSGATHNRFEHSVGTYYLTGKLVETIQNRTNENIMHEYLKEIKELDNYYERNKIRMRKIDAYVKELIKIAGLCHDLGHGPFSHLFDDLFVPMIDQSKLTKEQKELLHHEGRSCKLVELIWKSNSELLKIMTINDIKFIQSLIEPPKKQHFIYQIVSNNLNGLDVDKFDYLNRDAHMMNIKEHSADSTRLIEDVYVIDNKICYSKNSYMDVINLFYSRYNLHKDIYQHKVVISIQFMISEIMKLLNPYLEIDKAIFNMEKFIGLTDSSIMTFTTSYKKIMEKNGMEFDNNIVLADNLIKRIKNRDLYHLIGHYVTPKMKKYKFNAKVDDKTKKELLVFQTNIGFVSHDKKNPLDNIWCYNKKKVRVGGSDNKCFKMEKDMITHMLPQRITESMTLLFSRNKLNKEVCNIINDAAKDFFHTVDSESPEE